MHTDKSTEPVVAGVPVPHPQYHDGDQTLQTQAWTTSLCDCTDDFGNCCVTFWCPCITFGRIAEIVDKGTTPCVTSGAIYALLLGLTGCQWIYSCMYRSNFRAQYNLPEEPCCDCCVHFCCEYCALCQQYRELKNRGFDMAIGWQLNIERQGVAAASTQPPTMQGMGR